METVYFDHREDWRKWLQNNFETKKEIWLIYPKKESGRPRIIYNDAVEEALCFGWIDSNLKSIDEDLSAQKFSPRNPGSDFSQANIERLRWLDKMNLLHPSVRSSVRRVIRRKFYFAQDILDRIKEDEEAWRNYEKFSASYRRIRIAYIESARRRPEEFEKRLQNFILKTRQNKLIRGHGGIGKYY